MFERCFASTHGVENTARNLERSYRIHEGITVNRESH